MRPALCQCGTVMPQRLMASTGQSSGRSMAPSILYPSTLGQRPAALADRRFARDLNLDQVFGSLAAGGEESDFAELYYTPLTDLSCVAYRHEVLADLERPEVALVVGQFGEAMGKVREIMALARSLFHPLQAERVVVDAVVAYCEAVRALVSRLESLELSSRGFNDFRDYLTTYYASPAFQALVDGAREVRAGLASVTYSVRIRGARVTVSEQGGEPDYAAEVQSLFAKFTEGPVKDYRLELADYLQMDRVESQVLELVARLNPGPFEALHRYVGAHKSYIDEAVAAFDRDAQFYLSYLGYIAPLREAGLQFCYPRLSTSAESTEADDVFDLALAAKLAGPGPADDKVVPSSFYFRANERVIVVTGPNSGGKTTFARAFGQLHYLAGLGLPVPARDASIVLPDHVFTLFEQEEQLEAGRSHLEDELVYVHEMLGQATARSVVVMNETFSSTTLRDAARLGRAVLARLAQRRSFCVLVTFVDELATANDATVSMVATVDPEDPLVRTYKVVRQPPAGTAYAAALAERYGLARHAAEESVPR